MPCSAACVRRMRAPLAAALCGAGLLASAQAHGSAPDGPSGMVVLDREDRLVVTDLSGANQRVVRTPPGEARNPSWAPDGSRVAFTRGGRVYVAELATGRVRRIETRPPSVGAPRWAPGGERVAYEFWDGRRACDRHAKRDAGIAIADDMAGSRGRAVAGVQPIPRQPKIAREYAVSSWHPTRARLLYLRVLWPEGDCGLYLGGGPLETALLHVGAGGGRPTPIARSHLIGSAQWSPDGSAVAYGERVERCAVYVARSDGKGRRRVFDGLHSDEGCIAGGDPLFAWSRPGNELYVAGGGDLRAIDLRSRRERVLAGRGTRCTADFPCRSFIHATSPDGRFVAEEVEGGTAGERAIVVVSIDGVERRRLSLQPAEGFAAVYIR